MAPGIRNGETVGTNKILNIGPEEHHTTKCDQNHSKDEVTMVALNEPAPSAQKITTPSNMITPSATNRRASIGFNDNSRNEPNDFYGLRTNP